MQAYFIIISAALPLAHNVMHILAIPASPYPANANDKKYLSFKLFYHIPVFWHVHVYGVVNGGLLASVCCEGLWSGLMSYLIMPNIACCVQVLENLEGARAFGLPVAFIYRDSNTLFELPIRYNTAYMRRVVDKLVGVCY